LEQIRKLFNFLTTLFSRKSNKTKNSAFIDAEKLAELIGTCTDENWKEKLTEYEEDLYKRGFLAARQSLQATISLHSSGFKGKTKLFK